MDRSPSNGPNKAKTPEVNKIGKYFIDTFEFYTFLSILGESVSKQHESVRVYDAFVEDESVAFGACYDFDMPGGGVSPEEIGVDYIDVASFVKRLSDFVDWVLTHDIIVTLLGSTYIVGEPSHFTAYLALVGLVTVILRAHRSEFDDEVAVIEFVSHFS